MSMSGHSSTLPPCSTPTPNDSNDADLDTRTAKRPKFPRLLVVESTDPQKLRDLNDDIMDLTIRGVTSASVSIKWMGPALLIEVFHESYSRNLQNITQINKFPMKVSPTSLGTWEREWQNSAEQQRACPTRRSEMPLIPQLGIETCPLWLKPTEFLSTELVENNQQEPSSLHSKRSHCQRKYGWASNSLMYIFMFHHHADASGARSSATIPRSVEPERRYAKHALPLATARIHALTLTTLNAWTVKVHTQPPAGIVRDLWQSCSPNPSRHLPQPTQSLVMPQHLSNTFHMHVPWPSTKLTWSIAILGEENARLREVINKLRQGNASPQQRLDGFGKRLSNLEKSRVDDAHQGTSIDLAQTITPTPVGSTHSPSTASHNSAVPPDTTGIVHNTTSVGSAHDANPVGNTHSHPVSKANRASQRCREAPTP